MRIYSFFADVMDDRAYIRDKKEMNHAKNVLRLVVGNRVRVIDGLYEYSAIIESISSREIILDIKSREKDNYSLTTDIDAYVGIVKNEAMSEMITHLTEIGVNSFTPLVTRYSSSSINMDRINKITKEAAKQCLAVKGMNILESKKIEDLILTNYDVVILGRERSNSKRISDLQHRIKKAKKVAFIVGPEGGFTEQEVALLEKSSDAISLGKRIYRAETAAIVIAGIIKEFI